jgi:hypothetical protein
MSETPTFMEVPESIRGLMKTSVEQTRNAFNAVVASSERLMQNMNASMPMAGAFKAFNDKVAAFTRQNAEANFNYVTRLAEARQMSDMVEMHNNYLRQQMETYNRQMEELRELVSQMMREGTQAAGNIAQNAQNMTPKF